MRQILVTALVGLIVSASGGGASAQHAASPPTGEVITDPEWTAFPSANDLNRFYPDEAILQFVRGRATMACIVGPDGAMTACNIVGETPPGYNFGRQALKMAHLFRIKPSRDDGRSLAGGKLLIPVKWSMGPANEKPGDFANYSPQVEKRVTWSAQPTWTQMDAVYPPGAPSLGIVALDCDVTASGELDKCVAFTQSPAGRGFGAASVKVSHFFKAAPRKDGKPLAGSKVQVYLQFYPPPSAP